MKLDAGRLADAMGLATSMSSGLLAFLGDGGWSKWLHTGWSAHGGIVAAQLASSGFRGPRRGLDHPYGVYGAFLGKPDLDLSKITDGIGETWLGATAQAKLYPCAHVIHPYIATALAFREEKFATANLAIENISSIRCIMAPWAIPIVAEPREIKVAPRNDLEAIASLPFMVAAALIEGRVDLATLSSATIQNPEIRALSKRIGCIADASLGAGFDGRMDIVLRDGARSSRPTGAMPANEARIVAKFRANTTRHSQGPCDALLKASMDGAPHGSELMRLAAAAIAPQPSARGA